MEITLAVLVGALFACGFYLLQERNLLRMVFGLAILNTATNLLVVTAGRVTRGRPALIEDGAGTLAGQGVNPLPQALALTAVVIGFGLFAFTLVLVYRSYPVLGTLDTDAHTREDDSAPQPPEPGGEPDAGSERSPGRSLHGGEELPGVCASHEVTERR